MQDIQTSESSYQKEQDHLVFSRHEKIIIGIAVASAWVLGIIGFYLYYQEHNINATTLDIVYHTLGLFILEFDIIGAMPAPLEIARWLAPISLSYAAVKTVMALMGSKLALLKIRRLKNHAIICGLDENSLQTIASLAAAKVATVVITDPNPLCGWARKHGAHILDCNPADATGLLRANIQQAAYLLVSTGSDEINIEIAYHAFKQCHERTAKPPVSLECVVNIHQQHLIPLLSDQAIFAEDYDQFSARIINHYADTARLLLQHYGPERQLANLNDRAQKLSVMIVGNHDFVDDLISRFACIGHYGSDQPLTIILIGQDASRRLQQINERQPALAEILQLQAKDLDLTQIHSASSQKMIENFAPDIVYICANSTELTLSWAQILLRLTDDIPIIVSQFGHRAIASAINESLSTQKRIVFTEILEQSASFSNVFKAEQDKMAKAIHENYIAIQKAAGDDPATNPSLTDWQHLPESLKDANRNQADHMAIKCRLITDKDHYSSADVEKALDPSTIEQLSMVEHNRWVAEKLITGWRYTSGEKNTALRLSPNLIPWGELPENEREKDRDTVRNLPQLVRLQESLDAPKPATSDQ